MFILRQLYCQIPQKLCFSIIILILEDLLGSRKRKFLRDKNEKMQLFYTEMSKASRNKFNFNRIKREWKALFRLKQSKAIAKQNKEDR